MVAQEVARYHAHQLHQEEVVIYYYHHQETVADIHLRDGQLAVVAVPQAHIMRHIITILQQATKHYMTVGQLILQV